MSKKSVKTKVKKSVKAKVVKAKVVKAKSVKISPNIMTEVNIKNFRLRLLIIDSSFF